MQWSRFGGAWIGALVVGCGGNLGAPDAAPGDAFDGEVLDAVSRDTAPSWDASITFDSGVMDARTEDAQCPAGATVRTGEPCAEEGARCSAFEEHEYPACFQRRRGAPATCKCEHHAWMCLIYDLPCPEPADGGTCPPPAEILRGGSCNLSYMVDPSRMCPSVENAYPPGCPSYEMAKCWCADGYWLCGVYSIPCFGDSDHPPDPCPAPETVHAGAACTAGDHTCPSTDNAYPSCVTDRYEPTTCTCLGAQWRCQVYPVRCGS